MGAATLTDELDPRRFGEKAATLARLHRAGFPVPAGIALGAELFDGWQGAEPPQAVATEVAAAVAALGPGPVVVRSSAVGEDGAAASHAGMFVTRLDVTGANEALAAITDIRDSARLGRVSVYRGRSTPAPVAVLVQRQVEAVCAGVAFSADPVTGERTTVRISAVRGLAEALVSGIALAEDWIVAEGTAPTRVAEAPEGTVLDVGTARDVADLCRKVESALGVPVDVEWACDETGVKIVQARPITVVPSPPQDPLEGSGWQKDEVHYPEPFTPFGASVLFGSEGPMPRATAAMAGEFGLVVKEMQTKVVGGEVYLRAVPVIGPAEPKGSAPPAWLLGMLARVVPPLRARMRAAQRVIEKGLLDDLPRQWSRHLRSQWEERTGRLAGVALDVLDDPDLLVHGEDVLGVVVDGQHLHFRLVIPYVVAVHEWVQAAEQHLGWDTERAVAALPSPASMSGVRELAAIGRSIPTEDRAVVGRSGDPVAALEDLGHADLARRLVTWIARNAWRTSNYDPGSPALAERPALIAAALVELASHDARTGPDTVVPAAVGQAPESVQTAYARARELAPIREDNVLLTDNVPLGLLRRWLVEVAGRLVDRGLLDRRDDAAYLEFGELAMVLTGGELADARRLVTQRRGEEAWTRAHPGPAFVGTPGAPPDVRHLPSAGRRINAAMLWLIGQEYPPAHRAVARSHGVLRGIGASAGIYRGPVRVIRGESDFGRLRSGDVMVCRVTTPSWTILFAMAGALVTDGGGLLSHAAIVAREHGLPAVVATSTATRELRDGDVVEVDGGSGTVRRVSDVRRVR